MGRRNRGRPSIARGRACDCPTSLARCPAVPEHERRSRAGVFRRRHRRGHHHRAQPLQILRGGRPQFLLRLQGPRRRRAAGRRKSLASVMCSRAACGGPATGCGSQRSSIEADSRRASLGRQNFDGRSRTCSTSRTASPRTSSGSSNRRSKAPRSSGPPQAARTASTPMISICGRYLTIYAMRRRPTPRRIRLLERRWRSTRTLLLALTNAGMRARCSRSTMRLPARHDGDAAACLRSSRGAALANGSGDATVLAQLRHSAP